MGDGGGSCLVVELRHLKGGLWAVRHKPESQLGGLAGGGGPTSRRPRVDLGRLREGKQLS